MLKIVNSRQSDFPPANSFILKNRKSRLRLKFLPSGNIQVFACRVARTLSSHFPTLVSTSVREISVLPCHNFPCTPWHFSSTHTCIRVSWNTHLKPTHGQHITADTWPAVEEPRVGVSTGVANSRADSAELLQSYVYYYYQGLLQATYICSRNWGAGFQQHSFIPHPPSLFLHPAY